VIMAVPTISLDLLEHFSPVILFLLVFALVYGILQWAKILGESRPLHSIIAFLSSFFIAVFSEPARTMIRFIIPWFMVLAIFIVLSIMLYKVFGATDSDVRSVIKNRPDVQWTLFIIIIIIVLGALSQAYGQSQLGITNSTDTRIDVGNPDTKDTASGSFNQNLGATFYHPKVLGTIFLFLVGAVTVAFLSRPVFKN
jgi:hypothetical protein